MSTLIEALPGLSMPVEQVTRTLARMWDVEPVSPGTGVSDFRASQMNLIVHFGLKTSEREALDAFNTAVRFAQRYPCRIIVLCPEEKKRDASERLDGKLFSQCYIGRDQREMCCTEALILGYSVSESDFLENQISLWLETDLPVYHWLHRVPGERICDHYLSFMKRCNRVLFDSAVCGERYSDVRWPNPERVRDLAYARLLPVRQNLGHFLSAYAPEELVGELSGITVRYVEPLRAEGELLGQWMLARLNKCLETLEKDSKLSLNLEPAEEGGDDLLVEWGFTAQKKYFFWDYRQRTRSGRVTCNFGGGRVEQTLHIETVRPASALAEALFF